MRICVIGAGAAGICAARRLHEDALENGTFDELELSVFEQCSELGGTWVLDESSGVDEAMSWDEHGGTEVPMPTPHSSMYANLRSVRSRRNFWHFFQNCSPVENC